MSKLEKKLEELGYELIKLQNKKFICLKVFDDEIEIIITLNNGIIIKNLCEIRIQGSYGFFNQLMLNEFYKNLTRAFNQMQKDLEELAKCQS